LKQFRKTKEDLFICEECERVFTRKCELGVHNNKKHNGQKLYFDKWIKENGENLCKICGNETIFTGFKIGYKHCCSKECSKKYKQKQTEEAIFKKYGVIHIMQLEEFKEKAKQTNLQKFGSISYTGTNAYKQSLLNNFGVENNFQREDIKEKNKQIHLKNLGVENPFQSEKMKRKIKQTLLKNYGVENSMQNQKSHTKQQKAAFKLNYFRDTNIYYRGSFELDFLEKYYPKYPDIQNSKSIKYIFDNKNKVYHPDFYIPSLNLIIECKNSYLVKRDKLQIVAKKKATIANGFKYIMIVDKDYTKFNSIFL
jgi:hypothetical protein